jgi:hypothetical protein
MLKEAYENERYRPTSWAKFNGNLFPSSSSSLIVVSNDNCQRILVGYSEIIVNHMGTKSRSEKLVVQRSPLAVTPKG